MHRLLLVALLGCAIALTPRAGQAQDLIRGPVTPLDQSSVQMAVDSRLPLGQVGDPDAGPS
jgi:hypothetical protein